MKCPSNLRKGYSKGRTRTHRVAGVKTVPAVLEAGEGLGRSLQKRQLKELERVAGVAILGERVTIRTRVD